MVIELIYIYSYRGNIPNLLDHVYNFAINKLQVHPQEINVKMCLASTTRIEYRVNMQLQRIYYTYVTARALL